MSKKPKTEPRSKYRPPESYRSQDPIKRERQLANLVSFKGKRKRAKGLNMRQLQRANIIEFATTFLGLSFAKRPAQEVLLRSLYGLPLDKGQLAIYRELTGNTEPFEPEQAKTEAAWALGARGREW